MSRDNLLQILKGFGDIVVDFEKPTLSPISTGSLSVDWVCGGGLHRGMLNTNWGPEGGCKTTMSLESCVEAQKCNDNTGEVFFVDMENKLRDYEFIQALGIDLDRFYLLRPGNGDIAAEAINRLIESDQFELGVVDSITDLVPTVGHTADVKDYQMALVARLTSKWLPVLKPILGTSHTALLFLSQERVDIGAYAPRGHTPVHPGGGKAILQGSVVMNYFRKISKAIELGGQPVGIHTRVRNTKNQMAPPYRQVDYDFYFVPDEYHSIGVDKVMDIFTIATKLNVLVVEGRTYYFRGEKIGVNATAVQEILRQDTDLQAAIREDVMAVEDDPSPAGEEEELEPEFS